MAANPKPKRIFYGWWVVTAGFLIILYTSGIVHFGFTAVFEPIANEFGWSYTSISLAASMRGLETGLISPLLGFLVDRWGPRRLVFGGAIVTGIGLVLLSRIDSLATFYGAFFVMSCGLTTSGHGVMMPAVANWFRRKVSLAMGVMASGAAVGGLLVPVVAILVDTFQWRTAMLILGLGTLAVCLPLSLLIRGKPEQYGYQVDGEDGVAVSASQGVQPAGSPGVEYTAREAMKRRAFWHISLALMCHSVVLGAVLTHVMPYFSSIGVDRTTASLAASAVPMTSIFGRLTFGWLGDRLNKGRLTAAALVMTGVGMLLFGYLATWGMWLLAPFLIVFGTGWGATVPLRPALLREHFGTVRFGTIHGFAVGLMQLGTMIGAPLAGWVFDEWHSYVGVWYALAALSAVGVVIILTTPLSEAAVASKLKARDKV